MTIAKLIRYDLNLFRVFQNVSKKSALNIFKHFHKYFQKLNLNIKLSLLQIAAVQFFLSEMNVFWFPIFLYLP